MNEVTVFSNNQFGELRVIEKNGEPWFVANDVCRALEISNSRMATDRLDDDEKNTVSLTDGNRGNPYTTIISEAGLYSLVLGSRKPEARQFKRWVTHDVIPTIRKHGMYATPGTLKELLKNPNYVIDLLQALQEEQSARIEAEEQVIALKQQNTTQAKEITTLQPKGKYYDEVLKCTNPIPITQIADDYGWSAKKMNRYLSDKKIQYKIGKKYRKWTLYQKYADKGYTKSETSIVRNEYGEERAYIHMYWTQRGRYFIYETLKKDGIYPLIEQDDYCPF